MIDCSITESERHGLHRAWPGTGLNRPSQVPKKVREVIKMIQDDGWYLDRQKGGHRQFVHPIKPGHVTISGNSGVDMAPGTYNNILKQAGLK
jgi:predicted RNA binding protein YcfA (HicA-like mRNA interferase family)